MEMSEGLLFETTNAVVRLLNNFSHKNNISSANLIRRLDYLYERLSDFLSRELSSSWRSDELSVNESENFDNSQNIPVDTFQPVSSKESPDNISINYKCAICDKDIAMFNSDMNLSIALHSQEAAHQKALKLRGEPTVNMTKNDAEADETKLNEKFDEKQIAKVSSTWYTCRFCNFNTKHYEAIIIHSCEKQVADRDGIPFTERLETKYFCKICKVYTWSMKNMGEHIGGLAHQQNLKKEVKDSPNNNSKFFCSLCCVHTSSKENMKDHITGQGHQTKLQKVITDPNIVNVDSTGISFFCKLCSVNLPNLKDMESHVSEPKHIIKSITQTELEASNIITVTGNSKGTFFCKLCSVYTDSIKNMKGHVEEISHNTIACVLKNDSYIRVVDITKDQYYCNLCSASLSSVKCVTDHMLGKTHSKKLKKVNKENSN